MGTRIIAEAGVNHNGEMELALRLCDAAKSSGADIVKFQTFTTSKILVKDAELADYQKANAKSPGSQFEMVRALELSRDQFSRIKEYCDDIGIEFLSTPDDEDSLDFLVDVLGRETLKVGSGEITNISFLRRIGEKRRDVILSTGMATLAEVDRALEVVSKAGARAISLLHCTSNYPCAFHEVNLRAMITLREAFGLPVGYSDHTHGIEVSVAAVALGATIIEKHLTLDKTLTGPDHKASLDGREFTSLVSAIRNIEVAFGDGRKHPTDSEMRTRLAVRRSIVAARPIRKGEVLTDRLLTTKRTNGRGVPAEMWDIVLGRSADRAYSADQPIEL